MRTAGAFSLLLAAAVGGCSREPAFDERFEEVTTSISASAAAIDAEIMATDSPVAPVVSKD